MSTLLIIANVVGYIGLLMLYMQTTLGSRHIFKIFTTDTVLVNKLHKYIGIYGMLFVFAHPVLEMVVRLESLSWLFVPSFVVTNETFITFGRFAVLMSLAVWVTSAIVREKIKWRPWKYIHLLAYPTVFLAFVHVPLIGTFFADYLWVKVVWGILFASFLAATLLRLRYWSGAGKVQYKLVEEKLVGQDIVLIKLQPLGKKLESKIGQHFFLQNGSFKSEHPFTIIRNEDGVLSFGIRRVGKFWDELLKKKLGETIYVDGPYGVFTKEAQNTEPKAIISAGIGVTPFIDLVEDFGANTVYFNCNRSAEEVIEGEMLRQKTEQYVDILEDSKGANVEAVEGRISANLIQEKLGSRAASLPYFVCGSPRFIGYMKKTLGELGVPKNKIYYEELGF
jgi:predicted ferric reductase